jgi:RNA polymerase sigma-70 factor (ECF subfamily)
LVEDPGEYLTRAKAEFPGTRLDLERAIASLPEGARTVVILRDIYGYKYDEIAKMQGVALGTVKAQIHRARRMMRERLDP